MINQQSTNRVTANVLHIKKKGDKQQALGALLMGTSNVSALGFELTQMRFFYFSRGSSWSGLKKKISWKEVQYVRPVSYD